MGTPPDPYGPHWVRFSSAHFDLVFPYLPPAHSCILSVGQVGLQKVQAASAGAAPRPGVRTNVPNVDADPDAAVWSRGPMRNQHLLMTQRMTLHLKALHFFFRESRSCIYRDRVCNPGAKHLMQIPALRHIYQPLTRLCRGETRLADSALRMQHQRCSRRYGLPPPPPPPPRDSEWMLRPPRPDLPVGGRSRILELGTESPRIGGPHERKPARGPEGSSARGPRTRSHSLRSRQSKHDGRQTFTHFAT